ncbi:hypothetical protein MKS88_001409 [Plasmodium brasilianum]|uniref:Thioredoxin domain-containing protein n=2 Tax=Plasmodium (Plasmodium) TaxID=418103 RepID=A0A1D3JLE7_PLAMA|nr:conserved Plasmodium protein, unknown function [Plasmodium malariae]KAI4840053.1 hypothetical protein MKS88_001409 [Plasmodium brasilianum]SBT87417.1 conserved Plasmodium protein, unknown function [Plasmodium malariae]
MSMLLYLSRFFLCWLQLFLVRSKRVVVLYDHVHIISPMRKEILHITKKHKLIRKLNFIFPKKEKNRYEMKNLENIPLYVVTNEFDEVILSFNWDYGSDEITKSQKKESDAYHCSDEQGVNYNGGGSSSSNSSNSSSSSSNNFQYDVVCPEKENSDLLFPVVKYNEKSREEINLNKIHNNNCVGIFFFDVKTAEAYRDDIVHLFNKNLKEKKKNKLFFGSKIKPTNLEYFQKIKNSYNLKIDFILIPHYNELQNILKNKKVFYGTPIYYINKIRLYKSPIKKYFYQFFFHKNLKNDVKVKVELYPNVFITCTIEDGNDVTGEGDDKVITENGSTTNDSTIKEKKKKKEREGKEKKNDPFLIIQLETSDKKKYVPIFFSYDQAYNFYKIFLKYYKNHFFEYCLPKPDIILNSFENLQYLLKMANDKKLKQYHNIFFVPMSTSYNDNIYSNQMNVFLFYLKKIFQKINYDLFRSFRKNLNYLIEDYLYE